MRFFTFTILILGLLIINPNQTQAYTETGSGMPMVVEINPTDPGPNQTVRATIKSYSFDLNQANIIWLVNGVQVNPSSQTNSIIFKTGNTGSATIINVTASINQQQSQKTVTIRPATVNLVWQADTIVPSNYPGKPLASAGSLITVIALPNFISSGGDNIAPENLVYDWEKDHQKITSLSGLGKNTFKINSTAGGSIISVTASTPDKKTVAVNSIRINEVSPKLVIYENNPLTGLLTNKALTGQIKLTADEISLKAEPFYFSSTNLNYKWLLNGKVFNTDTIVSNQTLLGKPSSGSGQSTITIEAESMVKPIKKASALLQILFSNENTF